MAEGEAVTEFDQILAFAKCVRKFKCNIEKEFTVVINPILTEIKYKHLSTAELDDGIESIEDVLKSLQEISKTVVKVKDEFQEAKIHALQLQLRTAQIRERSGRLLGLRNDSGCFSADSRVLSSGSILVTQPSDADLEEDNSSTSRAVNSVHTEPTQHEDTSQLLNKDGDSIC
ncbi:uncharacterized protein LOC123541752 isoform X3 [Mercenaria mercenaria]|uniref:uncharacterized protein LOC123541752 isoform X3 n=1 Tax=Mercenaria mercenaria TaxID=6596 RepID=UPI00234FAAA1|nr:uncharacterized protein LOC123541752 isoform X3 [Mercenaria mercenaria]